MGRNGRTASGITVSVILLVLFASCALRAKAVSPEAVPPEDRYRDFVARKESAGRHWEKTRGIFCRRFHISAIPVRFCEDPEYENFYVAYAYCGAELLGEAHRIRYEKRNLFPDFSRARVYLFNGRSEAVRGAMGRLPKANVKEENDEIVRVTILLPLEGGGEAALVVDRPEARCYELTDLE